MKPHSCNLCGLSEQQMKGKPLLTFLDKWDEIPKERKKWNRQTNKQKTHHICFLFYRKWKIDLKNQGMLFTKSVGKGLQGSMANACDGNRKKKHSGKNKITKFKLIICVLKKCIKKNQQTPHLNTQTKSQNLHLEGFQNVLFTAGGNFLLCWCSAFPSHHVDMCDQRHGVI